MTSSVAKTTITTTTTTKRKETIWDSVDEPLMKKPKVDEKKPDAVKPVEEKKPSPTRSWSPNQMFDFVVTNIANYNPEQIKKMSTALGVVFVANAVPVSDELKDKIVKAQQIKKRDKRIKKHVDVVSKELIDNGYYKAGDRIAIQFRDGIIEKGTVTSVSNVFVYFKLDIHENEFKNGYRAHSKFMTKIVS